MAIVVSSLVHPSIATGFTQSAPFHRGQLLAVRFDAERLETRGTPVAVLDGVAQARTAGTRRSAGTRCGLPSPSISISIRSRTTASIRRSKALRLDAESPTTEHPRLPRPGRRGPQLLLLERRHPQGRRGRPGLPLHRVLEADARRAAAPSRLRFQADHVRQSRATGSSRCASSPCAAARPPSSKRSSICRARPGGLSNSTYPHAGTARRG
jgi:hypothetical protein